MAEEDKSSKVFIKFTAAPGIVTERRMTDKDFKALGIEHETVVFNRGNRYMVDASEMPESVVRVFQDDDDFSVGTSDRPAKSFTAEKYDAVEEETTLPSGGEGQGLTSGGGTAATGTTGGATGGTTTGNVSSAGASGGSTAPTT